MPGQVDAVPVHRGRWRDAVVTAVQPGAEIDHNSVGVRCDERSYPVVEHLRPKCCLAHHAGLHPEAGEVVVDVADDVVCQRVAQYRSCPPAVQRSRVFGEKRCLLDRRQIGGRNPHDCERTPVSWLNNQPKTFTALEITSAAVDSATNACTVIIALAQRASGMVSVGENAITLVTLT